MYVAPIFDRMPPIDTGFPSDAQTRADRLDRERREFIRTAAIAVAAAVDSEGCRAFTPTEAWQKAEALWKLKPEDC